MLRSRQSLRDRVSLFHKPAQIRQPVVAAIDTLSRFPPEVQVMAPAAVLVLMARSTGLSAVDLLRRAERLLHDADSPFATEIKAMGEYARNELGVRNAP
ncbi:MAG: hypothetical protein ACXIUZ_01885 [Lysobacteraceae bacterium]